MLERKSYGDFAKLGQLIRDIRVALLTTVDRDGHFHTRPVQTLQVEGWLRLLRQIVLQDKWICLTAQLGYNELYPLSHQPTDKVHLTAQPVELGHQHRTTQCTAGLERSGKLRSACERVSALTISTSVYHSTMSKPSRAANALIAARCASRPRPECPCLSGALAGAGVRYGTNSGLS
jgi:hypothetical protein